MVLKFKIHYLNLWSQCANYGCWCGSFKCSCLREIRSHLFRQSYVWLKPDAVPAYWLPVQVVQQVGGGSIYGPLGPGPTVICIGAQQYLPSSPKCFGPFVHVYSHGSQVILEWMTRNSSGDEIANVNFLYHIVHVLQNMVDSCTNSATDRGSVL